MTDELLVTKFFIPPQGTKNLPRERLFADLDRGLAPENRLILVSAPAGYGKTALAADWARRLESTPGAPVVAWLSLDAGDNDPAIFFPYLAASVQKALPGAGETAHALLQSPQGAPPRSALAGLSNDLAQLGRGVVLVLDDYHHIRTPAIHDDLAYWIDHLPPNAHLLVATRSDPPFPLHRYRGRGQMIELRLDDLRFTPEEVAGFLEQFTGADLARADVETLAGRTEGWIAGIQMAALSLRGVADKAQFVQSLAGSNRYILDYLAEEVIRGQPEDVQQFLLRTSILNRLCGPLCDALLAAEPGAGQAMLERLESDNLFLIPLDEERYWYRYHHLFGDLLNLRLGQAVRGEPNVIASLHRRAADWLAANGWESEAIQHYINAGDFEEAAALVEQHTLRLFALGELHRLLGWIRRLPPELAAQRPWLSVYQAWALVFAGRLAEAETHLGAAEAAMEAGDLSEDERRRLQGDGIAIRTMAALMSGDVKGAAARVNLPADAIPPDRPFARSVVAWVTGYVRRMQGDLPAAIAAFEEALNLGRQMDNVWTMLSAAVDLGEVLRQSGRLADAEAVYRQTLAAVAGSRSPNPGFLGRLKSFLANLLLEKNEIDAAHALALEAVEQNRGWENPNHTAFGALVLARVELVRRDDEAVERALAAVDETAARVTVMPHIQTAARVLRVRMWLAQGRLAEAEAWAAGQQLEPPFDEEKLGRALFAARVRRAVGDLAAARRLLSQLESDARAGGKINALIEILVLQALCEPEGERSQSLLAEAVALGVPAGYRRVFLQEGEAMRVRLDRLRAPARRADARLAAHIDALLPAFEEGAPAGAPVDSPLTERELEILACMAEGLSNQEIGRRLYISPGTVKAHSAAIYRKLDVANRSAAVSAAKDRGLV